MTDLPFSRAHWDVAEKMVRFVFRVTEKWKEAFGEEYTDELHWSIFSFFMGPPTHALHARDIFNQHLHSEGFPFSLVCENLPRSPNLGYEGLLRTFRDAPQFLEEGEGRRARVFTTTRYFDQQHQSWTRQSGNELITTVNECGFGNFYLNPYLTDEIARNTFDQFWVTYVQFWRQMLLGIFRDEQFNFDQCYALQKSQFSAVRWHLIANVYLSVKERRDDKRAYPISRKELIESVSRRLGDPEPSIKEALNDLVHYCVIKPVPSSDRTIQYSLSLSTQAHLTEHFNMAIGEASRICQKLCET